MAVLRSPNPQAEVRFLPPRPMVGSTGVRLGLISLGERSDGLQRKSSNLLPTTTNKENQDGAVAVLMLVVVLLYFIDKNS